MMLEKQPKKQIIEDSPPQLQSPGLAKMEPLKGEAGNEFDWILYPEIPIL